MPSVAPYRTGIKAEVAKRPNVSPAESVNNQLTDARESARSLAEALDKTRRTMGSMNDLDSWIGNECGYEAAESIAAQALRAYRDSGRGNI